jgi:hypothetical protein
VACVVVVANPMGTTTFPDPAGGGWNPGGCQLADEPRMETGETRWIYGDTHSAKNLNTQPMEMPFIETKAASKDR